jgi:hypothetical protein
LLVFGETTFEFVQSVFWREIIRHDDVFTVGPRHIRRSS